MSAPLTVVTLRDAEGRTLVVGPFLNPDESHAFAAQMAPGGDLSLADLHATVEPLFDPLEYLEGLA